MNTSDLDLSNAPKKDKALPVDDDGSVESDEEKPTKRSGRRKIKIEYIQDKNRRHITFSKRKAGIMKKVSIADCRLGWACCQRLVPCWTSSWTRRLICVYNKKTLGVRAQHTHGYPSASPRCFRDWSRLYFHHCQVAAYCYQA